jgi:hypothetical protein
MPDVVMLLIKLLTTLCFSFSKFASLEVKLSAVIPPWASDIRIISHSAPIRKNISRSRFTGKHKNEEISSVQDIVVHLRSRRLLGYDDGGNEENEENDASSSPTAGNVEPGNSDITYSASLVPPDNNNNNNVEDDGDDLGSDDEAGILDSPSIYMDISENATFTDVSDFYNSLLTCMEGEPIVLSVCMECVYPLIANVLSKYQKLICCFGFKLLTVRYFSR